ncbi:unnamed protein product [Paramecium sonneborni]|uniref:VWFA domain-containing protein n=1 Tax=Paramecium sonneborni TaxID=65129 RepID=A0A8S1M3S8_9CILI|nr:unnamed protein product [Paramecium sonneborni]
MDQINKSQIDQINNQQRLIQEKQQQNQIQVNQLNFAQFALPKQFSLNAQPNQENKKSEGYLMQDDEFIDPVKEQVKKSAKNYDLNKELSFELKALNKIQKSSSMKNQYIPAMISLKTKETYIEADNQNQRAGVDLICLIDRSSSMMGDKIEMVRQTLLILLNFLGSKDRLQLIIFNGTAERITPLKCVSEENRNYFEQKIKEIAACGSTDISSATKIAFQQLKDRQYRNTVTSIFLLSDGQDDSAFMNIQNQISQIQDVFTLNTFGFGKDNDAKMMTEISNLKDGSFYFVQEISLLDEFFVDALGELISVVGEQISIQLQYVSQSPFQDIKISKTFGTMWNLKDNKYEIHLPQIACGTRKDYVFELELPKTNCQFNDNQRNVKLIQAQLTITDTQTKQVISKQDCLELVILNENEEHNQNEDDIDVYCQYFRVKGTDVINSARQLCEAHQNDQALTLINEMLIQIKSKQKVAASDQCQGIIQDLEQALLASKKKEYFNYGRAQMCQMVNNNFQQKGLNSQFDYQGQQKQQMHPGIYQNFCSNQMMQCAQINKPPQLNYQFLKKPQ